MAESASGFENLSHKGRERGKVDNHNTSKGGEIKRLTKKGIQAGDSTTVPSQSGRKPKLFMSKSGGGVGGSSVEPQKRRTSE